jgi:magnesium transporter
LIAYYVHRGGQAERLEAIEPDWLTPDSGVRVWADVTEPSETDGRVLQTLFGLHPLAVQDAVETVNHPKVEMFSGVLHAVLHGIDFLADTDTFETHDTDFFLTRGYLITVHDGKRRSIQRIHELCLRNGAVLAEGPAALMHRIVDTMVENYRPEVEELEKRLDEIEERVLEQPSPALTRQILAVKRDISQLRRIVMPQRDAVGRLARREFDVIDQEMSYRFRDIYDALVRLSDDASIFQERVTGILDAHLATISNRLALSSQRLAAVATIFGTLTVLTGIYGMNVPLPTIGGSESAEFWWILGLMAIVTVGLYAAFRKAGWL